MQGEYSNSSIRAVFPVGVIGSGKSHLGKQMAANDPGVMIVSDDAIREMIYGRYCYKPPYERMVDRIVTDVVLNLFSSSCSVYIDKPNITVRERTSMITKIRDRVGKIRIEAIYFKPDVACLKRRIDSPRGCSEKLWEQVYNDQLKVIEGPTQEEGFTSISYFEYPHKPITSFYTMQAAFCAKNKLPVFAPEEHCPSCKKPIWVGMVEKTAGTQLVTACPHCHKSFC